MPYQPLPDSKLIRILDFSWVLAGPYATRILADFGMEVIQIQPLLPGTDDNFSQSYYNTWNRNKLGITLNLSNPQGIDLAKRLVKISDAVVENFSSRVMANWGLDYPELKKLKPDIIMVSLSVLGHTGPQKDYTGYGPAAQAFSGITGLTGYPGQPPSGIGFSYADHIAALYASLALLSALEYRRRTGQGQYIDLSETEAVTALIPEPIIDYTLNGEIPQPEGNSSRLFAPYGVYRCRGKDRWVAISVTTEQEWVNFKKAIGNPPWAEDYRFSSMKNRLYNREALDSFVQAWTADHTAEEIMVLLQHEGVAAGLVQNAEDLGRDPQLRDRGFFLEEKHSDQGKPLCDGSPIHLQDNPARYRNPAPVRGQDNDYVYGQLLGLCQAEINRLKEQNVI